MKYRVLKIGRWVVDFLFADSKYDVEGVLFVLYERGASNNIQRRAERIMVSGKLNTGFTFTDQRSRKAVVVVGPSSSSEQFLNTLVHEIHHLAVAIANSLGVDLEGETPAYIIGDTAMELARTICELGCPCQDEIG